MTGSAESRNVAGELVPLLSSIRLPFGSRVLHVHPPAESGSLLCERLWWTAGSDGARPGWLARVGRDVAHGAGLPFATGQFDFAVCAGVLERLPHPAPFCAELMRTARAGYVECRRAAAQLLHPDPTIRWLVDHECDTLFFRDPRPAHAAALDVLRQRIDTTRPVDASMAWACRSPRWRPLMFAELLWTNRFKYRVVRPVDG